MEYNKYINIDGDLSHHLLFFAWLFDKRAEHNLSHLPIFSLIRKVIKYDDIFLHEIINTNITISNQNTSLDIDIILNTDKLHLSMSIDTLGVQISFLSTCITLSYQELFNFIYYDIYLNISSYQGKMIVRIFINESLLFNNIIYDKSHLSQQGRKNIVQKINNLLVQNKIDKQYTIDNIDDVAVTFMEKSGEIISNDVLSDYQIANKNLNYGYVFKKHSFDVYGYKLNMVLKQQPKILSIGSSRAHFFKNKFFNNSFYNCSYTMTYLQEGLQFLKDVLKAYKPQAILISLEFWWFLSDNYKEVPFLPLHTQKEHFDIDYINKFFEYCELGYITDDTLQTVLLSNDLLFKNKYTNLDNLGLRGIEYSEGYRNDGYYFYGKGIFEKDNSNHKEYLSCKQEIDKNSFHFIKSTQVNDNKYKLFDEIITLCKTNDIKVVSVLTPMSRKIYARLTNYPDYEYINILIDRLKNDENIEFYNFLSPDSISTLDSEFYDCYHGGDITYLRILKNLYDNNSSVKEYINYDYITKSIENNQGKVIE